MPVRIKYKKGIDKVTVCVENRCERVRAEDFFSTVFTLAMKFITEKKAKATATIMAVDEEEENPVYVDVDEDYEEESPGEEEKPLLGLF